MDLRNKMRERTGNHKYAIPQKWNSSTIPERIITGAIKDYTSAIESCFTKLREKQINHFEIHKKVKKQRTQTLSIPKECFGKENVLFPNLNLPDPTKDKKDIGIKKGLHLHGTRRTRRV